MKDTGQRETGTGLNSNVSPPGSGFTTHPISKGALPEYN